MSSNNKRRRTTTSSNNDKHITDLPDGILVGIASYLAKPSAVLFAIAMNSQQTSKAILSSTNWSVLDFSDIEKSLAAKLSDADIDKILRSVDAVNNLKILKLAGCVNISGSGLDVLRSSNAIKQIDISLVGKHEAPLIEPEPFLSEDVVIPILDCLTNSRGGVSSLRQLEFPKKWRNEQSTQIDQFLLGYNSYLMYQRRCCSKCNRVCVRTRVRRSINLDGWIGDQYGTQNYTCSGCLKHFCHDDDCVDENGITYTAWCRMCEKLYCKDCTLISTCSQCRSYACNECDGMKKCEGEGCETVFCDDCCEKKTCSFCGKMRCLACAHIFRCFSDHCGIVACDECNQSRRGKDESKCECGGRLLESGLV